MAIKRAINRLIFRLTLNIVTVSGLSYLCKVTYLFIFTQAKAPDHNMLFGKKFLVTVGLLSAVVFVSTTSMQQSKPAEDKKFKNLKVIPKNITEEH